MRTDRSVTLVVALALLAGCQINRANPGEVYAWAAPPQAAVGLGGGGSGAFASKADLAVEAVEDVPERQLRITVEQAVAEALDANRTVRQARLAAAIALTREHEARAVLRPSLTFTGSYTRREAAPQAVAPELGATFTVGPRDVGSFQLALSFPIFAFGKYINAYKAAKLSRQGAEADLHATESDIAAAVTASAFDLLLTIRAVDVARSDEAARAQQVKDAQALLDAGRVTRSALLEAQVEHDRAERTREKAESLIPIQRRVVNQLLGRPTDAATEVVDAPATRAPNWSLDRLMAEAHERRPELRSARLGLKAAVRNHRAAIGQALPELRGNLSFSNSNSPFSSPTDVASIGVSLEVPLYVGGANYARIRRARHEVEVARVSMRDLAAQIETEVASALREVNETYRDIAVARRSIERAKESLRIQREKFNSGRATSREVLDSTTLWTDSRFAHIGALYSYNNALRELHRVRGADPRRSPLPPEK